MGFFEEGIGGRLHRVNRMRKPFYPVCDSAQWRIEVVCVGTTLLAGLTHSAEHNPSPRAVQRWDFPNAVGGWDL